MLDFFAVLSTATGGRIHIDECPQLWAELVARGSKPFEVGASSGPQISEAVSLRVGQVEVFVHRKRSLMSEERQARIAAITAALSEGNEGQQEKGHAA